MRKIEDIEKMTLEEVKERFNNSAEHTVDSLSMWEKIYEWKHQNMLNQRLERINNSMLTLTKIVTALTAINVVVAIISVAINFI